MRLPEFLRTTTFRWTLLVAGTFTLCTLLMFGFVYWQVAEFVTSRVDDVINSDADVIKSHPGQPVLDGINDRLRQDPRRLKLAGLFSADGTWIAGNVESLPEDLEPDAPAHTISLVRIDNRGRETQDVRGVARRLGNGEILVIARNIDELHATAEIVGSVLALGLLPAVGLSLVAGIFLSRRAKRRIEQVNSKVQRIIAGELRERLPTQGVNDPFEELAVIVNRMLDEIETLIRGIAGVGDDIAHDLRTPLTRVRVLLERGRANARTAEDLRGVIDQAINGLDQSLAIITALLRIAEIEQTRRLDGFSRIGLAELVREVGDLYEPIAEDKGVAFQVAAEADRVVCGDRDLLFEAISNLVDNAIKFTPAGGRVEVAVVPAGDDALVRVRDSGPGIGRTERDIVTRRFYRSDKSRHADGYGLGLSLVAAILKLHGFQLSISSGPGCVVEIACTATARLTAPRVHAEAPVLH